MLSIDHLIELMEKLPKTSHKLTEASIKSKDRMNSNTTKLLEDHVNGSEGTILFINILDRILRSFFGPPTSTY